VLHVYHSVGRDGATYVSCIRQGRCDICVSQKAGTVLHVSRGRQGRCYMCITQ
jgi:hypothetical protein